MKHWTEEQTENMTAPGINMAADDHRVLSIAKSSDGLIEFREECDGYFVKRCSKDEAVETLQEALDYVRSL